MATEEEVKVWVREEYALIKAEEQAMCEHLISGTYPPDDIDNLFCDQCGGIVTMADHSENGEQRVAHPRVQGRGRNNA